MFEGKLKWNEPLAIYTYTREKLPLKLNESQELHFIQAVQEVCFEQPGRFAKADQASFDEITQTILLEGNAEVQSGQYHLQGNSINLYLDVKKGLHKVTKNPPYK
ncbi:MAG: hypothetical protein Ct9H300mP28_28420 [Pseudomonadota bacterium]|nr:MAG: hypothetical protein Ct9H300mP28_28420 [Pseudomonadota bacterium]